MKSSFLQMFVDGKSLWKLITELVARYSTDKSTAIFWIERRKKIDHTWRDTLNAEEKKEIQLEPWARGIALSLDAELFALVMACVTSPEMDRSIDQNDRDGGFDSRKSQISYRMVFVIDFGIHRNEPLLFFSFGLSLLRPSHWMFYAKVAKHLIIKFANKWISNKLGTGKRRKFAGSVLVLLWTRKLYRIFQVDMKSLRCLNAYQDLLWDSYGHVWIVPA